ncbi:hypothetical protein ABK040_010384 [Willaertia magna]
MQNEGTVYTVDLPKFLIAFSSPEGREIFEECMIERNLHAFFPLIEQFHTQTDPGYCGLGTLVMILNSLKIDPNRSLFKNYPWRWFSEEMLDCCIPLDIVRKEGITLEQFQCLARCNQTVCELYRPQQSSLEEFRNAIIKSIKSNNPKLITEIDNQPSFVAVAYDRQFLEQTGSGHFSPVAAYNEKRDMVLVLDVARFKYPPYWIKTELLWKSLFPLDSSTGLSRGYFVLKKNNNLQSLDSSSICCRVVMKDKWTQTVSQLLNTTLEITKDYNEKKVNSDKLDWKLFISCFVEKLKDKISTIIEPSTENGQQIKIVQELTEEVKQNSLFKQIQQHYNLDETNAALLTVLLLSLPFYFFNNDPQIIEGLKELQQRMILGKVLNNNNSTSTCGCNNPILSSHISHFYSQFSALSDMMNKTNNN